MTMYKASVGCTIRACHDMHHFKGRLFRKSISFCGLDKAQKKEAAECNTYVICQEIYHCKGHVPFTPLHTSCTQSVHTKLC